MDFEALLRFGRHTTQIADAAEEGPSLDDGEANASSGISNSCRILVGRCVMAFARAAAAADVADGEMRGVSVGGVPVLLCRVGERVYAVSDKCTHRGGTLSRGSFADGVVTCPKHGSQFDVRTGRNVRGPKILGLKGKAGDVAVYEARVEGDDILVDIG